MTSTPLDYLSAAGEQASVTQPLTWFMAIVSIIVCVATAIFIILAIRRNQATTGGAAETAATPVERGGNGIRWIGWAMVLSAIPILATLIWTVAALAHVGRLPRDEAFTIEVAPQQWWWKATYTGPDPSQNFVTANEIHIPVGVPVRLRLVGRDVIHSFWVPKLAGKTDAIPGQVNLTWLKAEMPGRYWGQCAEYCGDQHAHMAFEVVADTPSAFAQWRARQLQTAPPPVTPEQKHGLALVEYRCGLCHAVAGTNAQAVIAPDLTHLMSRRTIAAGMLQTDPAIIAGWVEDAPSLKPGTLMPAQHLSGDQLNDVLAYLETLK